MTNINELRQRIAVTLDKFGIPKEPVEDWDFESKQPSPSVGPRSNKGGLVPTGGSGSKEDPLIMDLDAISDAEVAASGSVRDRMYETLDAAHGEDREQYRVTQVPMGSSDITAAKSPIDTQNPGRHIADIKLDKELKEWYPKMKKPKYPVNISKLKQRLARLAKKSFSNIDDINKSIEIREMEEDPDYVSEGQAKEWQDDLDSQALQDDAERRR